MASNMVEALRDRFKEYTQNELVKNIPIEIEIYTSKK